MGQCCNWCSGTFENGFSGTHISLFQTWMWYHSQIVDHFVKENETTVFAFFNSGIHVSCSNICVTLSNIPYLPFTKRAALRCTISSLSELYFWRGARQWRCILGRTLPGRSMRFPSFSGQPFRLRLRKDNLEFALLWPQKVSGPSIFYYVYSKISIKQRRTV